MGQHDSVITCAKSHDINNEKKLHVIFASERSLFNLKTMQAHEGAASTLQKLSESGIKMSLVCLDVKKETIQKPEYNEIVQFFNDGDFFGIERKIQASNQEKIRNYAKKHGVMYEHLHTTIAMEFVFAAVANDIETSKPIVLCTTAEELTCAQYAKMDSYLLKDLADIEKINDLPLYVKYQTIKKAY